MENNIEEKKEEKGWSLIMQINNWGSNNRHKKSILIIFFIFISVTK